MRLSEEMMNRFDLNSDGNISRTEFNATCAQGLFEEGKSG
jgi:Ca2+-binding EF-hand superfamily protein